jgi:hypothetical protein
MSNMNKYRKYLLAITSTALLALLGSSNSLAGPSRITPSQSAQKQSAQDQAQPFHAEITGSATTKPTDNPCVFNDVGLGTGTADPIGAVSFEDRLLLNTCTVSGGFEAIGYNFFTVANGDKLFGNQHVILVRQPGVGSLGNGTFRLTGGTGRFAGAVGEGQLIVTIPPASRTVTAVFDGVITLQQTP